MGDGIDVILNETVQLLANAKGLKKEETPRIRFDLGSKEMLSKIINEFLSNVAGAACIFATCNNKRIISLPQMTSALRIAIPRQLFQYAIPPSSKIAGHALKMAQQENQELSRQASCSKIVPSDRNALRKDWLNGGHLHLSPVSRMNMASPLPYLNPLPAPSSSSVSASAVGIGV